ncbi:MAG: hydroxyisourate hydrolase [Sulfitobacter sp.]|nr:hydroxyisourate hydrolase [Sulfitobacter sp.]
MSVGYLTTHVLDTARGLPAGGLKVTLFRLEGANRLKLAEMTTNADGRTDGPILPQGQMPAGTYELLFEAGAYLKGAGLSQDTTPFLDEIPIRFGITDDNVHYHVPLLLSPYGYSTYRGS